MRHLHVLQFVHLHVLHTQPLNWEFQPIILFVLFRSSQIIDICIFKTKHDPQLCTHIVEGQTEAEVLAPESVQLKSIINLCGLTCSSLILANPNFTENHASTCCQGCFISHLVRVGGMGGHLLSSGYATLSWMTPNMDKMHQQGTFWLCFPFSAFFVNELCWEC